MIRQGYIIITILLLLSSQGCEESVDGCLQRNAANFDVTAVTACEDCCVLPVVSLDVELAYDTLRLAYGTEYPLNDQDTVTVLSFELPLTNFGFINNGVVTEVVDTLVDFVPRKRDDYVTVSQSTRFEIGHADFDVDFDSFSCILGYDQSELETLKPYVDINPNNKVVQFVRNFHNDTIDSYSQLNMLIEMEDSIRTIQVAELADVVKVIELEERLVASQGINWQVDMRIDLKQVLSGVTPSLSNEDIALLIGNNLSSSVTGN